MIQQPNVKFLKIDSVSSHLLLVIVRSRDGILDKGDVGLRFNWYFCILRCVIPSFIMNENSHMIKIK